MLILSLRVYIMYVYIFFNLLNMKKKTLKTKGTTFY